MHIYICQFNNCVYCAYVTAMSKYVNWRSCSLVHLSFYYVFAHLGEMYMPFARMQANVVWDSKWNLKAERSKQEKYTAFNQCQIFTLVAIETAGLFGPETFSFLRDLGCHLKQVTREAKSFSYLRQGLSVAVQRGNATAVMGTIGGTTPSVDFFSWLPFLLWGALSASPVTIWLFLCVFMLLIIIYIIIIAWAGPVQCSYSRPQWGNPQHAT